MKLVKTTPIFIIGILFFISCNPFKTPDLELSKHDIAISNTVGDEFKVTVMSGSIWKSEIANTSTDDNSWISVTPVSGKEGTSVLTIAVAKSNNTNAVRKAAIAIDNKNQSDTVYITQEIVNVAIADSKFKAYLVENFDKNNDGEISDYEQNFITRIDCSKRNIESLDGIENLKSLVYLKCDNNDIDTLDLTILKHVTSVNCDYNNIVSLKADSIPTLFELSCNHNRLTKLNFRKCSALKDLEFGYNPLTEINISYCTSLKTLNSNQYAITSIETINATGCKALEELNCSFSGVSTLIIKGCDKLKKLDCSGNSLNTLDISESTMLTEIRCNSNNLSSLYVGRCWYLELLYCSDNLIEVLDLDLCPYLKELWCSDNTKLTTIRVKKKPADLFYFGEWGDPQEYKREYMTSSGAYILHYFYYPKIYINGVFSNEIYKKLILL
ncbi:MAG: hypothetical protein PHD11_09665 [Bacteroidales bacterium]|nr:hypothetical protein [Bacteroidales bacterium]MDD4670426.1 hypothetical protein [Bacteroidales bacterium]